jgi:hypothetical protein
MEHGTLVTDLDRLTVHERVNWTGRRRGRG